MDHMIDKHYMYAMKNINNKWGGEFWWQSAMGTNMSNCDRTMPMWSPCET